LSVYAIKSDVSKEAFDNNVSKDLLKQIIEVNLNLVFSGILRQFLHFVESLFGYFGYSRYFSLDEVKIEDVGHDLPLHLPFMTLGEKESTA